MSKSLAKLKMLHIGSGPAAKPGWINIDNVAYPGVDHVLDVRQGLPFGDVDYIYAEHFLEHLSYEDGLAFLKECRRALNGGGLLRLSTPNLDWVWATQYHYGQWPANADAIRDCFSINKSFHGWGHQFLYNVHTLAASLKAAGFAELVVCRYGQSTRAELQGIEEHEPYHDTPELPHVLVVEAGGIAEPQTDPALTESLADFKQALSAH
jgi:predicted SAM-dependent methyltransferase